jgi:hypothetical protein
MTKLSPQAQAVLNATDYPEDWATRMRVAGALRAAADQVVPEEPGLNPVDVWSTYDWNHMNATKYQREESRRQLLAIAAELEGSNA